MLPTNGRKLCVVTQCFAVIQAPVNGILLFFVGRGGGLHGCAIELAFFGKQRGWVFFLGSSAYFDHGTRTLLLHYSTSTWSFFSILERV